MILDVWVLAWAALLLLLLGLVWALYRRAPQLKLSREVPPAGFVGRDVRCRIQVKLTSLLPLRYVIEDAPPLTIIPG